MSESIGFNLLHKDVQRWIWAQNWTELRDIQERAIKPILSANCDVIISASTAAGKTEAAFIPSCSRITETNPEGVGILYISPLKALINDQFRRLQDLCDVLCLPVTPWHGDVLRSVKDKQKKNPSGIILITPESLESLLLNQAGWCTQAFSSLSHIIIDEFHAFLGTERGCQLQSLMHRIEFMLDRIVPRVALSATLGDMEQVARFLRPSTKNFPCRIIESNTSRSDLKIQLRGYINKANKSEKSITVFEEIVHDLYKILRGKSHLVFANSRERTEDIAATLADFCKKNGVPNEFFPHHGSLSKEIRESLEARLQVNNLPTSAVCTMTLELGIDIGSVDSIAQVTAPHSVASLRQRLGRSGRRGDAAILRLFIPEDEISVKSHISDRLRLETVQCIAMINLLLNKWCEPAPDNQYHLSTLIQQTLSVIGQYGGVRANQLWALLCETGPFHLVDQQIYARLLKALGEQNLITQMRDGQLVLGARGERIVENYSFYTAFNTPEEYRLECEARVIGTVPIVNPLVVGQLIIFAGKRWEVLNINSDKKVITLRRASGGRPPKFGGEGQSVHDIVRKEMRRIYIDKSIPNYLDKTAKETLSEGIECFHALELENTSLLQIGATVHILPWCGDQTTITITVLLRRAGLAADCFGGVIDIRNCTLDTFYKTVSAILPNGHPTPEELASHVPDTIVEKHDPFIPKELRNLAYGKKYFNVDGAVKWMKGFQK
ncbi:DEAD/DEAH box helicase [Prosthecochloris sp. GSB1]|uniref:DEAD/DEAH box helicase n=1 Tax=Prosthecochloris sp. GSB1 TaxID=281093 RepID=UPI000B8CBD63|nr:DEAD/DEAH box helicase [Prosthecochloris sp. GSB1]ASQ91319.1 DEAD/DEAH box helicase [Prosthecochloris sp. GSB1]